MTTAIDDLRAGDSVWVDGEQHVYIQEREGLIEVGRNGHSSMVTRSKVSLVPPPVVSGDDPFNGLVQQLQGLVLKLKADLVGAEAKVSRRRLQVRKLEQVVKMLGCQVEAKPAPGRKSAFGSQLACGHWPASKDHKACIAAREAGA